MIHSARLKVANISFDICFVLNSGDERTNEMYENNNYYRPWLWIGLVDQKKK